MADDKKQFENEEIQKGLEAFVDRQLGLDFSLAEKNTAKEKEVSKERDLDIIGYDESRTDQHTMQKDMSRVKKKPDRSEEPSAAHNPGKRIYDDMLVSTQSYLYDEKQYEAERRRKRREKSEDERDTRRRRSDYEDGQSTRRRRSDYEDEQSTRRRRSDYEDEQSTRRRQDDDDYSRQANRNMANKKNSNLKKQAKKKKKNRGAKAFLVFLAVLFVVVFGGIYMAVHHVYSKMAYNETEDMDNQPYKEDGVINVLLIGNDSRLGGDDGRSDAMILVSISDKTKTVTMTSFLRDMYVEIPGYDGNRLNAAYAYGGPKLLMETIELNFDIPVHRYALVNFEAFANLVDAVGGIELEVTNEEVQLINGYLMEYNQLLNRDLTYDWLDETASGVLHLNGAQALAYTRNRYIGTDFGRTERQRKVLAEVFKKLPGAMMTNANGVIDGLFPNLTTNLKERECYMIAMGGWKILGYEMVQQCVPVEGTYSNATIRSMAVLQVDFEANKQFLKETLYGE